ncbi:unnamed protein product, partial [Ectocarpus sp. 6 AP-2014]
KPLDIDDGIDAVLSYQDTAPPSPSSSRGGETLRPTTGLKKRWADQDWSDDEYWGDDDVGHDSVFTDEEICLGESLWREWTRGPEEVCLFPSVWSQWTRTQPQKHGRVRGSGGRRTTTRKNKKRRCPRHIRDRRRRRALRRKQLARRARVGGRRRRPPASFRGGGDPPEGYQGTGEETVQVAAQVAEQETVQGPAVSGAQTDPATPTGKAYDPRYEASDKTHIATYRERSETNLKKREGTAPSAKRTKYGIGSMPKLEVVLRGLTEDSKGLPLKNGVFFDRKQLSDLKDDFNIAYMLDPNHIGVALGKTKVKKGGRSLVVKSFDHGEYTLEDDETKIRQWELLECKCGGGVKLDDALRRFILHLLSTQTIMKIHGAPFVRGDKYPEMLWNTRDAITRLEEEEDVELEDGEMDL